MAHDALTAFIADYIAGRRQAKLDVFDKDAIKRLDGADATQQAASLQQRRELEQRYTPQAWLTDAASRAGQISLVTHAAKFTHGDSKSSSIYSETQQEEGYLSSASLTTLAVDAVGNAAALDVAKLLQTEVDGDSLLACLRRGDTTPLVAFADSPQQLADWVSGFSRALTTGEPTSHKLAKQVYFPVGDSYHLLSPLFATSLTHAMHQKLVSLRFGDEVKAIWQARRSNEWHAQPLVMFPSMAEMHFGGTKPQNISALNSARGGRAWLLSAQPPVWTTIRKPPHNITSVFSAGGRFDRSATSILRRIIGLIVSSGEYKNHHIRDARDEYIDELIDLLFEMASELQQEAWQGWTLKCTDLKPHQQLWLDPWRTKTDEAFALERDKDDWQQAVAEDFARWLNYRLRKHLPDVGMVEKREWQTRPRFREQLREMENIIQEALK